MTSSIPKAVTAHRTVSQEAERNGGELVTRELDLEKYRNNSHVTLDHSPKAEE